MFHSSYSRGGATRFFLASLALAALAGTAAAAPLQFSSPFTPTSQASKTSQTVTGTPEGLTNEPDALFHRESFFGDVDGYRNRLSDDGLSITPILELEAFSAAGGGHGGADVDGLFDVAFDFDLERITRGLWQDAALHLNVLDIFGPSLTGRHVGDISGVSNLAGFNSFRLQELWIQQNLFKKRVSIRFGLLAADTEFFTSQASSLFLDGTFGAFTLVALNFNDAPVYPVAAPAIRIDVAPVSFLDFKAAVFAPDEGAENNFHGTDFSINGGDGALVAFEAAYLVNQSPERPRPHRDLQDRHVHPAGRLRFLRLAGRQRARPRQGAPQGHQHRGLRGGGPGTFQERAVHGGGVRARGLRHAELQLRARLLRCRAQFHRLRAHPAVRRGWGLPWAGRGSAASTRNPRRPRANPGIPRKP